MAYPKEVNFFSYKFKMGTEWYEKRFPYPERPARGDISPSYMQEKQVASRIHSLYPNTRIIAVLRNPLERALSHLMLELQNTLGALSKATVRDASMLASRNRKFVSHSLYYDSLQEYFRVFPRSSIKILFFESLQKDPAVFLKTLFDSAGVRSDLGSPTSPRGLNATGDYRFPNLFKALRLLSKGAKAFHITQELLEIIVDWGLRDWFFENMSILGDKRPLTFAEVFKESDRKLIMDDTAALTGELGITVPPSWSQAE